MAEGSGTDRGGVDAQPIPVESLRVAALSGDDPAPSTRQPYGLVRRLRPAAESDHGAAGARRVQPGQRAIVVSIAGGVGRTTVAASLAHTLAAARPGRALLIDGSNEPFRGLGSRLTDSATPTTVDAALTEDLRDPAVAAKLLYRDVETGLWVLPGPHQDQPLVGPRQLGHLARLLAPQVDALVMDCQPGASEIFAPYVSGNTVIVAVTRAQEADVVALAGALDTLTAKGVDRRRVICVINHGAVAERARSMRAALSALGTFTNVVVEFAADRALAGSTRICWSRVSGRTRHSAGTLATACVSYWTSGVAG